MHMNIGEHWGYNLPFKPLTKVNSIKQQAKPSTLSIYLKPNVMASNYDKPTIGLPV